MDNYLETVAEVYADMDDDQLVELYLQDTLTDEAKQLLLQELSARNISSDRNKLADFSRTSPGTAPTANETARVAAKKTTSWMVQTGILILVVIALNVGVSVFGAVVAPLIWSSDEDRACQEQGFWYGRSAADPSEIECSKWFFVPS